MTLRNFTEIVPFLFNTYEEREIQAQLVERGKRLIDSFERDKAEHEKLFWSSVTYKRLEPGDAELWELVASSLYAYDDHTRCKIGDLYYNNTRDAKYSWGRNDSLRILMYPPLDPSKVPQREAVLPLPEAKALIFKPATIAYQAYDTPPTYLENFWTLSEINQ